MRKKSVKGRNALQNRVCSRCEEGWGGMGKGGWGGGLSRRLLVVGRYGARQRFKGRRQSCIEGVGSVV